MGSSDESLTLENAPRAESTAGGGAARILYAQCWEDADILVEALGVQPGRTYVSVASGGDNSLALLIGDPERVIALDVSHAQLACLELRVAAYACLDDDKLLEFFGSRPSGRRDALYQTCRAALHSSDVRAFWDRRGALLARHGLGGVGRFERYFRLFRELVLPLVHDQATVDELFTPKSREERREFYDTRWNTWGWRAMVASFFSERVMGWLGREPAFFAHARSSLAAHVLQRARHALVELDPAENPYLNWIFMGDHGQALPLSLRTGSIQAIRRNLERLDLRCCSVDQFVQQELRRGKRYDGFNLSDVFEYMSETEYREALRGIVGVARPNARLVYWNMLVPRSRPEDFAGSLSSLDRLATDLHRRDKAFFYRALRVEAVR